MSPADAERVTGRVGVHLVALFGVEVRSRPEQLGTQPDCLFMRSSAVFDVQVEMQLLGCSMRPLRRNVVGRELHADAPLASGVDDAVETVVFEDVPAEDSSPERALGMQVGRVEHDHLTHDVHELRLVPASDCSGTIERPLSPVQREEPDNCPVSVPSSEATTESVTFSWTFVGQEGGIAQHIPKFTVGCPDVSFTVSAIEPGVMSHPPWLPAPSAQSPTLGQTYVYGP